MRIAGIGVDVVEIQRIEAAVARHGRKFLERIFTAAELEYCGAMTRPFACYAARFAAKEAVSKAFGTGIGPDLGWLDIEIRRKASGEPFVCLDGVGAAFAARNGIREVLLSLSHSENYAVANAVALGEE